MIIYLNIRLNPEGVSSITIQSIRFDLHREDVPASILTKLMVKPRNPNFIILFFIYYFLFKLVFNCYFNLICIVKLIIDVLLLLILNTTMDALQVGSGMTKEVVLVY